MLKGKTTNAKRSVNETSKQDKVIRRDGTPRGGKERRYKERAPLYRNDDPAFRDEKGTIGVNSPIFSDSDDSSFLITGHESSNNPVRYWSNIRRRTVDDSFLDMVIDHYPTAKEDESIRCILNYLMFGTWLDDQYDRLVLSGEIIAFCMDELER